MLIEVQISPDGVYEWQHRLLKRLASRGHGVTLTAGTAAEPWPASLDLLLRLESVVYGAAPGMVRVTRDVTQFGGDPAQADLCIDLTGAARPLALSPCWEGQTSLAGAISALLADRSPQLSVVQRMSGDRAEVLARGVAALPEKGVFGAGLRRACERMGDLLLQAVRDKERVVAATVSPTASTTLAKPAHINAFAPVAFGLNSLTAKIVDRLTRLATTAPQWRTAWRQTSLNTLETLAWGVTAFAILPDDGKRYFADPFGFHHDGVTHVFCEEYPYATGRGIISASTLSAAGASQPRPVLECDCHLSYPMIFEDAGTIYMIPETSQKRTLELWRAERVPDRWVRQAVLLEGVEASDATILRHEGRWWIFASVHDEGASSWDALGLFYADALEGPWRAHPGNPVLIDAGAARPAGHMISKRGKIFRPAQNCLRRYGAGLALAEVERLDLDGYRQTTLAELAPPLNALGAHTLNSAGGFELIDIFS